MTEGGQSARRSREAKAGVQRPVPDAGNPDSLELTIERPVSGGRMLARHDGQVVLVAGGIPGERVRVRIERVSRGTRWATVSDVIEASPERRVPICDPACGGAAYAHIAYPRQRALKAEVLADAFRRIGKITIDAPIAVAASPEHGYRLRARLHVRQRQVGFFREGTHTICDAGATLQLRDDTMAAVEALRKALDSRLAECEELIVAENVAATERVVHLVPRDGARFDDLRGRLAPPAGVTGVTTGARGRLVALAGARVVTDTTDQLFHATGTAPPPVPSAVWTRHAVSFFQGNRYLTGDLVRRVLAWADGDRFVDLYAGVGLFAIALAARGSRGLAVEGDPVSGGDLAANAKPWAARLRALHGRVEDVVTMPLDPVPDAVIVDPPRTGVSPEALAGLTSWAAPRLIYVSCDPPTLARDAAKITAAGYRLEAVEAFDLFPNTPHMEVIAVFANAPPR